MLHSRKRITRRPLVTTQMQFGWMEIMQLTITIGPWHIFSYAGISLNYMITTHPHAFDGVRQSLYRGFGSLFFFYSSIRSIFISPLCSFQEAEADCTMALGLDKKVSERLVFESDVFSFSFLFIFWSGKSFHVRECHFGVIKPVQLSSCYLFRIGSSPYHWVLSRLMTWLFCLQSVKAYLRRGTAREFLGYYKEANDGKKQLLLLLSKWFHLSEDNSETISVSYEQFVFVTAACYFFWWLVT